MNLPKVISTGLPNNRGIIVYDVLSASKDMYYQRVAVKADTGEVHCTCGDFKFYVKPRALRGRVSLITKGNCKHILAHRDEMAIDVAKAQGTEGMPPQILCEDSAHISGTFWKRYEPKEGFIYAAAA